MAVESYLTVSGNLTANPKSDLGPSGTLWAKIRVASTTRVFDRAQSQWRDGETVFIDVMCWRRLAENVVATLQRGDRVLVAGRLHQRSYEDAQGVRHTVTEIDAESVGPDLSRCAARLVRPSSSRPTVAVEEGAEEPPVEPDIASQELVAVAEVAA